MQHTCLVSESKFEKKKKKDPLESSQDRTLSPFPALMTVIRQNRAPSA